MIITTAITMTSSFSRSGISVLLLFVGSGVTVEVGISDDDDVSGGTAKEREGVKFIYFCHRGVGGGGGWGTRSRDWNAHVTCRKGMQSQRSRSKQSNIVELHGWHYNTCWDGNTPI